MFDMGGTLETLYHGERTYQKTAKALHALLAENGIDPRMTPDELWAAVYPNFLAYRKWGEEHSFELKPERIWCDFCFKGLDVDPLKIAAIAEKIAHMWELTYFERGMREHVPEMLEGLKSLGLRLSVISNTACEFQVFDTLEGYGIRQYFEDVTLSAVVGYRKPDPRIFEIACRQMRVLPENCVYVGDTLSRDVVGPQNAGYAKTIQIHSFLTQSRDTDCVGKVQPDHLITDISEVYPIMKSYLTSGN